MGEKQQKHENSTDNKTAVDEIIICIVNVIEIKSLNDYEFRKFVS